MEGSKQALAWGFGEELTTPHHKKTTGPRNWMVFLEQHRRWKMVMQFGTAWRRIFGHKKKEVGGGWRTLHNDELC
jgi:hypothetical protein